jgi:hypothetical protein
VHYWDLDKKESFDDFTDCKGEPHVGFFKRYNDILQGKTKEHYLERTQKDFDMFQWKQSNLEQELNKSKQADKDGIIKSMEDHRKAKIINGDLENIE